jgi:hypothetical protein
VNEDTEASARDSLLLLLLLFEMVVEVVVAVVVVTTIVVVCYEQYLKVTCVCVTCNYFLCFVRFQVLTAASMKFRIVFWYV